MTSIVEGPDSQDELSDATASDSESPTHTSGDCKTASLRLRKSLYVFGSLPPPFGIISSADIFALQPSCDLNRLGRV